MKVLFDFSRDNFTHRYRFLELVRNTILNSGNSLVTDLIEETKTFGNQLPKNVYEKLTHGISDSDCVIIEGTKVSLSLGYILTKATESGKPVLFLSDSKENNHQSRFVQSIKTKLLTSASYSTPTELRSVVKKFLEENAFIKTRFNLVLPIRLDSFVKLESSRLGISKTAYIIGLIQQEIDRKR